MGCVVCIGITVLGGFLGLDVWEVELQVIGYVFLRMIDIRGSDA